MLGRRVKSQLTSTYLMDISAMEKNEAGSGRTLCGQERPHCLILTSDNSTRPGLTSGKHLAGRGTASANSGGTRGSYLSGKWRWAPPARARGCLSLVGTMQDFEQVLSPGLAPEQTPVGQG